MLGHHTGDDDH